MKLISALLLFFSFLASQAQDLHFTQFYSSPLTLNPAQTGFFNGDFRIGGNFKSQWPWAIDNAVFNYRSFSVYADLALLKDVLPASDCFGIGLVILNDKAGDGHLKINKVLASVAYHKSLGAANNFFLSFGAGGGFVQKKVDYDELYFDAQWSEIFFDRSLPSTEPNSRNIDTKYFDLNAGVQFSYFHNENINLSIGSGLFHIIKPKESFYGNNNRLGIRPMVSALSFIRLSRKFHIEPSLLYTTQRKAQEIVINLLAGYTIVAEGALKNTVVYLGSSYRVKDAYVPVAGIQYKSFKVLMNFDVNLSSLTDASKGNGGFEISVVYIGRRPKALGKMLIPCPRM